jgi:hypothetical protein
VVPIDDKPEATSMSTFVDLLQHDFRMIAHCRPCERWVDVDLQAIVDAGLGGVSYIGKDARCSQCGETGTALIQPLGTGTGTG